MALVWHTFEIRSGGNLQFGLKPVWTFFATLSGGVLLTPPQIIEHGGGVYKFQYDADATGEAAGTIDCGAALANPADRYVTATLTVTQGRILAGFSSTGQVVVATNNDKGGYVLSPHGLDLVEIDGFSLPTTLAYIAAATAGATTKDPVANTTTFFAIGQPATARMLVRLGAIPGVRTSIIYY